MVRSSVPDAVTISISAPDDLDILVATLTGSTSLDRARHASGRAAVRF